MRLLVPGSRAAARIAAAPLLAICLAVCLAVAASLVHTQVHAQSQRPLPASARLADFEMRQYPEILLNGELARMSAGGQIRDAQNRIVMPAGISGTHPVLYERDPSGQVSRIWILTADEVKAAKARPQPK
jgi:hypothetical protein